MMVKRILVILLSCFAVVSCKTARIKKELKEFTGQQIVLPDSLRSTVNGRDTTLTDFMGAETKLVVFYDSVVCSFLPDQQDVRMAGSDRHIDRTEA